MLFLPLWPLALSMVGALDLPPAAAAALDHGRFAGTPRGFRIIAISQIADGCAAQRGDDAALARACVERAFARALETRPQGSSLDDGRAGLWLTHLALILGDGDETGPCLDEQLHRRVAEGLARRSLADPTGHASSYANRRERWPADQAATLAAIHRYDRAHEATLTDDALAKYRAAITRATDQATGLPWSEVHGFGTGRQPRGCALSWSVRYLSEVDAQLARAWWERYLETFLVDRVLLVGFREWPPGVERNADADSGPIVAGVGAAASAFGIAAARAMGDAALALRLEATANAVGLAANADASTRRAAASTLAEAVRFQAAHQASR